MYTKNKTRTRIERCVKFTLPMKKKISGLIGTIAIIALMVFNTQFTNNANNGNFSLSSPMMQSSASDSESSQVIHEICTSMTPYGNLDEITLRTRRSTSHEDRCCWETSPTERGYNSAKFGKISA